MTVDAIFRFMTAELEVLAKLLDKATPEQIQSFLDRHNRRMDRCERALDRLHFWGDDGDKKPA